MAGTSAFALTVCQPFATLIAEGVKPIENRPSRYGYRGGLWIHAGKSRDWLASHPSGQRSDLLFGAIIAHVELYDCVRQEELPDHLRDHAHAHGPWCLLLRDVRQLASPVPCASMLGLWRPQSAVAQRLLTTKF